MRRKIVMILLILLLALLQSALFPFLEIGSIKPNLMLIFICAFALMRGQKSGLLLGFAGGLATDLMFSQTLGFHALVYMWIGYAAGYFYRIFYDEDIKTPMLLIALGDLFFGICQYVFSFLMRGRIQFFFYLNRIILPEMLYTLVLAIVLYRVFYHINQWLGKTDKRSIDSVV